ncbi:MAG: ABC transporter ATP-binding protein [Bacilli bacterium]
MLKLENVSKKYGKKEVLRNINLDIRRGEITCLLGLNGVGKSTLLKAIMGLHPLTAGTITLDDHPITPKNITNIAFIPDTPIISQRFTIKEALQHMELFYGNNWNAEKAKEYLQFFALNETDKIKTLSKGNLSKFNLLLGLARNSEYIILDEPFSGIDVFSRDRIIQFLSSDFLEENQGILLTTHEIHEIEMFADRVILLSDSAIVADINPEQLRLETGMNIIDYMKEVYKQ